MKTENKTLPPIYENWLAFIENKASQNISEYPLFSDAHITGENTTDFGPYKFINPCSYTYYAYQPKIALILRVDDRINREIDYPEMKKTDTTSYHGGDFADEVAAIVSLSLGVRIKAGGRTREFREQDKFGRPIGWEKRQIPNIFPEYNRYKVPSVIKEHSIISLEPFKSFFKLSAETAIAVIKAARLYQDALWIVESEPSLAWIMLVSAIEVAATQWKKQNESPVERLKASKPELYKYLEKTKVENITSEVASYLSDSLGAIRKFIDFILEFLPEDPGRRPPQYLQHIWDKSEIKKSMRVIYNYRSQALHGGTPFPYPMCESPYYQKDFDSPAEKPIGLGCYAQGGTWRIEDTPMLINTFEYIVKNCLLNWWENLNNVKKDS